MAQDQSHLRVLYNDEGSLRIVTPTAGGAMTITEIAMSVVPTGLPYKVVNAADIPEDRTDRMGWFVDDADLDGGFGA